jgi:hypothetical protein
MNTSATCPKCGASLPADAPAGLCPQCLLAAGLAEPSQAAGVPTTDQPPAGRFVSPTPADSPRSFPNWKSWNSSAPAAWAPCTRPARSTLTASWP